MTCEFGSPFCLVIFSLPGKFPGMIFDRFRFLVTDVAWRGKALQILETQTLKRATSALEDARPQGLQSPRLSWSEANLRKSLLVMSLVGLAVAGPLGKVLWWHD